MKLLEVYRSILNYAGLDTDSDGFISAIIGDDRSPAMLNGERMVLPLDAHLRNPKDKVIFHPLSENILRGESDIIIKLRDVINIRLNYTFGIVCCGLMHLAASTELHHKLTPDQSELLIALGDVDTTSVKNFMSIMAEAIKNQANKLYLNIYLKRGGTINGKRYSRAGIITFNFFEELSKDVTELYNVKFRSKDRLTYLKLYQFILSEIKPGCTDYNRGSDSTVAPYLDALMKTSMTIASRLNDILEQYKDFIENAEDILFNGDWVETFENLNDLNSEMRLIPAQVGNEGAVMQADKPAPPAASVLPVNVPTTAPTLPMSYPANQYQPAPPQLPPVREHNGRLDWQSVVQHNPMVGAAGNALGGYMAQQQYYAQPQFQPAAWASAPSNQYPQQPQQYPQPYQQHYPQPYPSAQYPQSGNMGYVNRNV